MSITLGGTNPAVTFPDGTIQNTSANLTAPYTSNGVVYASSTTALSTGSALTYDGTYLTVGTSNASFKVGALGSNNFQIYNGALTQDGTNYAFAQNYTGVNTAINAASGGQILWQIAGSTKATFNSTGLGIGTTSPNSILDAYYATSPIGATTYGTAATLRAGTGTLSLTGANNRGIGTLVNTNQNTSTTLPYGGGYEVFGLLSVANASSGAGYGVYGIAAYSKSDGTAYAIRADAINTNSGNTAYGLYVGSVTGGANNYGVYVNDTSASNYFGGNLLVGTTSQIASGQVSINYDSSHQGMAFKPATNNTTFVVFTNASATVIGSISTSGGSVTLYNTTSDQRLKENIEDSESASSLIDSLQVRKYDWKFDGSHQRYGFIAQELVTVAPEAVHQPIDEKEMMAVDYSKLVPMLVKEIQSLRKRILTLENK
jgi:hypothetical protein